MPKYRESACSLADSATAQAFVLQVAEPRAHFFSPGFLQRPDEVGEERVAAEEVEVGRGLFGLRPYEFDLCGEGEEVVVVYDG